MAQKIRIKITPDGAGSGYSQVTVYSREYIADLCDCDTIAKDECLDCDCGEAWIAVRSPEVIQQQFYIADDVEGNREYILKRILKELGALVEFEDDIAEAEREESD